MRSVRSCDHRDDEDERGDDIASREAQAAAHARGEDYTLTAKRRLQTDRFRKGQSGLSALR